MNAGRLNMLFQEIWLGFVFCLHYEKGEFKPKEVTKYGYGKIYF